MWRPGREDSPSAAPKYRNLRSASTSIPGLKHPCPSVAGQGLLAFPVSGPPTPPSRLPVRTPPPPQPPTCGNAPSRSLRGPEVLIVGGAVRHVPRRPVSIETTPSARSIHLGSSSSPIGPRACSTGNRPCRAELFRWPPATARRYSLPPPPPAARITPPLGSACCPGQQARRRAADGTSPSATGSHLPVPAVRPPDSHSRSTSTTPKPRRSSRRPAFFPPPGSLHRGSTSSVVKTLVSTPLPRSGFRQPPRPLRMASLINHHRHKTATIPRPDLDNAISHRTCASPAVGQISPVVRPAKRRIPGFPTVCA